MGKTDDFFDFCGRHLGDAIATLILFVGIFLTVLYAYKTGDWDAVEKLAGALVLTAMGVLKLRPNPKNGNGNGQAKSEEKPPQ